MRRKGYRTCTRCHKNRQTRFFTPKGRICEACRKTKRSTTTKDARLQSTYGITMNEWEMMLDAQNGTCAICDGTRPTYDVDHSHAVERELKAAGISDLTATRMSVRGLICKRCNRRLLPASLDNPDILRSAINYLVDPPAHKILFGVNE